MCQPLRPWLTGASAVSKTGTLFSSNTIFELAHIASQPGSGFLYLDANYANGTSLNRLVLFPNTNLASLHIQPGSYVYTLSGTNQTITLSFTAAAVPEPQTFLMLLLGLGVVASTASAGAERQHPPGNDTPSMPAVTASPTPAVHDDGGQTHRASLAPCIGHLGLGCSGMRGRGTHHGDRVGGAGRVGGGCDRHPDRCASCGRWRHLVRRALRRGHMPGAVQCCDANSDFAFDTAGAALAATALLQQVFVDRPNQPFDSQPALTFGCGFATLGCRVNTPMSVDKRQPLRHHRQHLRSGQLGCQRRAFRRRHHPLGGHSNRPFGAYKPSDHGLGLGRVEPFNSSRSRTQRFRAGLLGLCRPVRMATLPLRARQAESSGT